jgi:hypothetical protein
MCVDKIKNSHLFQKMVTWVKHQTLHLVRGGIYAWSYVEILLIKYQVVKKGLYIWDTLIDAYSLWSTGKGKRDFQVPDLEFIKNGCLVKKGFWTDYLDRLEEDVNYDCIIYTKNYIEKHVYFHPSDIDMESPPLHAKSFLLCELTWEEIHGKENEEKEVKFETDSYNYLLVNNVFHHSFFVFFMKKHYNLDLSKKEYILTCYNKNFKRLIVTPQAGFVLE